MCFSDSSCRYNTSCVKNQHIRHAATQSRRLPYDLLLVMITEDALHTVTLSLDYCMADKCPALLKLPGPR